MCHKLKTKAKYDAKIAAFNPAFLPIPDYVMNDEVRNFEPPAEAYYMKHGDGADEISWIILDDNSKWPEQVWAIRNGFKDYLRENDLNLPDSFLEDDGDDIRYYLNHNKDYEETYKEMLKYDEIVYDYKIPLFEKFAEDTTDLDRGIIYGH